MKQSIFRWLIACLPLILCAIATSVIALSSNNITFEVFVTLTYILISLGIVLSIPLLSALAAWQYQEKSKNNALEKAKSSAALDHIRFLQRLNHELKNPLTSIVVNSDTLELDDPEERQILEAIKKQISRLVVLTRDIQKIVDVDKSDLDIRRIDLPQLFNELMDLIHDHPKAPERKFKLTIPTAPWPLPKISGDWNLILLAIYNLAENAIKFSANGDEIEIRAREESNHVIIEIADTGPGIPKEDLNHVWEELYRSTETKSVGGSGLGLSLVKAIAERHNGAVSVNSRKGRGTAFSISLPL